MEIKRANTTRIHIPASEESTESIQESTVPKKAINPGIAAMKDGFQASNKPGPLDKAFTRSFNPQPEPPELFQFETQNRPSPETQAELISELFASAPIPEDGKMQPIPEDGKLAPIPDDGRLPVPEDGKFSPVPDDGRLQPVPEDGKLAPVPEDGKQL